jgi:hypothetical protein
MRTTALFARSALIWRTRSRRTSGAGGTWPLENRLPANHALRTLAWSTLTLHGSCSRSALHGASWRSAWRSRTRRRRGVNGTRACLRRDHSSLLHNRLARCGLGRWRRGRDRLLACLCRWSRRRRFLRCRWWRCNYHGWRMSGRSDHHRRRSGRLFNSWRRHHCRRRRLDHGRCDHNTSFRCRSSRFRRYNSWFLSYWRLRSRSGWLHGNRWRCRRCGNYRRPDWRCGRMLLLLLSLPEQPCYVARLGDLGEVNLRFDLCRGCSLPRR